MAFLQEAGFASREEPEAAVGLSADALEAAEAVAKSRETAKALA